MKAFYKAILKARKKEGLKKNLKLCLDNGVCPNCAGEKLEHTANIDDYMCPDCSWKRSNLDEGWNNEGNN